MPAYTLVILDCDRRVQEVREFHADSKDAARHEAQAIFAQSHGAARCELWCQNERIFTDPK